MSENTEKLGDSTPENVEQLEEPAQEIPVRRGQYTFIYEEPNERESYEEIPDLDMVEIFRFLGVKVIPECLTRNLDPRPQTVDVKHSENCEAGRERGNSCVDQLRRLHEKFPKAFVNPDTIHAKIAASTANDNPMENASGDGEGGTENKHENGSENESDNDDNGKNTKN